MQINTLARGETWSPSRSEAKDFTPTYVDSSRKEHSSYQSDSGSSYHNINTAEFKVQTEDFFSRKQDENATRPE